MLPPPTQASISLKCNNSSSTGTSGGSSNLFISSTSATPRRPFSDLIGVVGRAEAEPPSLCLSSNGPATLFPPVPDHRRQFPAPPPHSAHMSATALLQKAAQMGATASGSSFLRSFGLAPSSSPAAASTEPPWKEQTSAGLGLGLPYDSSAGLPCLMMSSATLFESKPAATLDFLGLGMGPAGSSNAGGLSAFINSIGAGGLESYNRRSSPPPKVWDGGGGGGGEREPNDRAIL